MTLPGIHHVTAIAGAAQATLNAYTSVLGLRRVKTTVNFDDPTTHHLYYGDTTGQPGTILTFFPWAHATAGRSGAGMASAVALAVPPDALDTWQARLREAGLETTSTERFGETVVRFAAPDGLPLELVGTNRVTNGDAWAGGDVPPDAAIRGIDGVTLPALHRPRTEELLTDVFGWTRTAATDDRVRLEAPGDAPGRVVDLQTQPAHAPGRMGPGTVHHVAFRARTDEEQTAWQSTLRDRGLRVTDVKDRQYFRSIYFRDPTWTSGVLFEIATDGPGFTTDESVDALGSTLQLPPRLEDQRAELVDALPSLQS